MTKARYFGGLLWIVAGCSSAQIAPTTGEQPASTVVLDSKPLPEDVEIDSLMTTKRLVELKADIATAEARLAEAQKRSSGEQDEEQPQPISVGVVAIATGTSGRSAVLANATGERVRVRVGDSVGRLRITAIRDGAVEAVDAKGTPVVLGFGVPEQPQQSQRVGSAPYSLSSPLPFVPRPPPTATAGQQDG